MSYACSMYVLSGPGWLAGLLDGYAVLRLVIRHNKPPRRSTAICPSLLLRGNSRFFPPE